MLDFFIVSFVIKGDVILTSPRFLDHVEGKDDEDYDASFKIGYGSE